MLFYEKRHTPDLLAECSHVLGHDDNYYVLEAYRGGGTILSTFQIFQTICEAGIIIHVMRSRKRAQIALKTRIYSLSLAK